MANNPAPSTITISADGIVKWSEEYQYSSLTVLDSSNKIIFRPVEDEGFEADLKEIPDIWNEIKRLGPGVYRIKIKGREEDDNAVPWSDEVVADFNYKPKSGKKASGSAKTSPPPIPTPTPTVNPPPTKIVLTGTRSVGSLTNKISLPVAKGKETMSPITWVVIGGFAIIFITILFVGWMIHTNNANHSKQADMQMQDLIVIPQPSEVSPPTVPESAPVNSVAIGEKNVRIEFNDNKGPITFQVVGTASATNLNGTDKFYWDYVDEIYLGSRQPGAKQLEIEKTVPKGKVFRFLSPHGWSSKVSTHSSLNSFEAYVNTEGDRSKPKNWVTLKFNQEDGNQVRESYLIKALGEDIKLIFTLTPYQ